MRTFGVLLFLAASILGCLILGLMFCDGCGGSKDYAVNMDLALDRIQRIVGLIIAVIAAFSLLLRGTANETLEEQTGLILPLLGGVLLVTGHWGVAVAAAGVAAAIVAKGCFPGPDSTRT